MVITVNFIKTTTDMQVYIYSDYMRQYSQCYNVLYIYRHGQKYVVTINLIVLTGQNCKETRKKL
jgi:hypothetical protein